MCLRRFSVIRALTIGDEGELTASMSIVAAGREGESR
jgi:hypothetical protein